MEKRKPIIIKWSTVLLSLSIIILLIFAIVDSSITRPSINKKVENVSKDFDSLKIFLNVKIPQIDSALIKHDMQLKRQQHQLEKLKELTRAVKE